MFAPRSIGLALLLGLLPLTASAEDGEVVFRLSEAFAPLPALIARLCDRQLALGEATNVNGPAASARPLETASA
ncbi:hypothetical protein BWR19_18265 [Halomonas sp. 1513]|nr:hypothetical protein [Halomonas sp. 1513]APX94708.1 hypothetical protein BWR19_18265 [Halomonas sp. 1513]